MMKYLKIFFGFDAEACALLFDHSNCRDLKREVPEGYTGLSFRDRNDVESVLVKKGCTLVSISSTFYEKLLC